MTFDLHIHTTLSDGDVDPVEMSNMLLEHADYVSITDHDTAVFHRQFPECCSFSGIEITSHLYFGGSGILTEVLLYGFGLENISGLSKCYTWDLPELEEYLRPIKRQYGAKLFLAHPVLCARVGISFNDILGECCKFVDGLECLHPSVSEEEAKYLLDYCVEGGLLSSGGSDSHGVLESTPYLHLVSAYAELFRWIPEMAGKW